jgi:hypothetical protein
MTPERMEELLRECSWAPAVFARRCGYSISAGAAWTCGKTRIPQEVAEYLETAAVLLSSFDKPAGTQARRGRPRKAGKTP